MTSRSPIKSTGHPTLAAPSRRYPAAPMIGVCAAVWRGEKVCLVRRAAQPSAGLWAQPGGLVELGETLVEAVTREVREETRLVIENPVFNTYIDIILQDDEGAVERHFVLAMFAAVSLSGLAVAGDDAAALGWFTLEEMERLPLTGDSLNLVRASRALVG